MYVYMQERNFIYILEQKRMAIRKTTLMNSRT